MTDTPEQNDSRCLEPSCDEYMYFRVHGDLYGISAESIVAKALIESFCVCQESYRFVLSTPSPFPCLEMYIFRLD